MFYFKSLFMIKDRRIASELVEANPNSGNKLRLGRLLRRQARRNRFHAHNNTQLKSKVK